MTEAISNWRDRRAGELHYERHPYGLHQNPHEAHGDYDVRRKHDAWEAGFRDAERREEERREEEEAEERRAKQRQADRDREQYEYNRMMQEAQDEERYADENEEGNGDE